MKLPSQYDFIHIRRTDAIQECDTGLSRMQPILHKRSFKTMHVVYATDESNTKYNEILMAVLQKRNMTVYFPNKWLQLWFPKDNYMRFSIEQHLMGQAAEKHQWRRNISC